MSFIYISADTIISPLGFTSEENIAEIENERSGIQKHNHFHQKPVYASVIDDEKLNAAFSEISEEGNAYTRLEKMMILALYKTLQKVSFSISDETALLISTTKGNIDALAKDSVFPEKRAYLTELGKKIQSFFDFKNEPIIVSNACVSGILSVAIAKRLIENDSYKNAVVVGGDIVSEFTLSGFTSFQAISPLPCKPFSKNRDGITLGEAAVSVAISKKKEEKNSIQIIGEGSCNDANHISGPSRTGEGLYKSIHSALKEAKMSSTEIDYISAHGTATLFNDEMEAIAFKRLDLLKTPVNSLKGYYGHTLGASGLLEAVVGLHSLKNNTLYTSLGIDELGVSEPINVITKTEKKPLQRILKTASGFGGCNTAVIFKKIED